MTDPTQPALPDHPDTTESASIELPEADRRAHRSTARWAANRFLSVLRRTTPAVVFDRWGQPMGIPDYGSPAFAALPDNDPSREAALITAAEAWRQQAEERPARVHQAVLTELAIGQRERQAWETERDAAEQADWQQLVRDVRSWANHPTAVERAAFRARQQEAAARPVTATASWPVAIPGRPGWRRHLTPDGHQADRPDTDPTTGPTTGPNSLAESA